MVLELVDAQPVDRVIEGIDGGAGADRAEVTDGRARDKAALVQSRIPPDHRVGTDLGVSVQIRGTEQAGLDDPRPGIQLDDRLDEGRLARSVLDTLNVDFLVLHLPMCSFACGGVIRSGRP